MTRAHLDWLRLANIEEANREKVIGGTPPRWGAEILTNILSQADEAFVLVERCVFETVSEVVASSKEPHIAAEAAVIGAQLRGNLA
jgi:hypothetical protein